MQNTKPKIPMVPKYYYVINTNCHPTRLAEFYTYKYFGQICSWHHALAAAKKAEKRLHYHNILSTAIYGADFVIRDSNFLAECYGGATPEWRTPVKIESERN